MISLTQLSTGSGSEQLKETVVEAMETVKLNSDKIAIMEKKNSMLEDQLDLKERKINLLESKISDMETLQEAKARANLVTDSDAKVKEELLSFYKKKLEDDLKPKSIEDQASSVQHEALLAELIHLKEKLKMQEIELQKKDRLLKQSTFGATEYGQEKLKKEMVSDEISSYKKQIDSLQQAVEEQKTQLLLKERQIELANSKLENIAKSSSDSIQK
jgi:hypothetical protein